MYESNIAVSGELRALTEAAPIIAVLALSAAGVIILGGRGRPLLKKFDSCNHVGPVGLRQRILDVLHQLVSVLWHFSHWGRMLRLFALTAAAWLAEVGVFLVMAWALRLPLSGTWISRGAGTLGTLIPASPGHVGTFDYFAALGMRLHGVDASLAIAYAVMVHAVLWVPLTLLGVIFMLLPAGAGTRDER